MNARQEESIQRMNDLEIKVSTSRWTSRRTTRAQSPLEPLSPLKSREESPFATQELVEALNALQPVSPKQHGIRAKPKLMAQPRTTRDVHKLPFKLESATDYLTWKNAMKRLLTKEGLIYFVSGEAPQPECPESDDEESQFSYRKWEELNSLTETVIMSNINKFHNSLLLQCQGAQAMWNALQDLYQHKSEANIARLEEDLQSVKWKKNTTIETYILDIDTKA